MHSLHGADYVQMIIAFSPLMSHHLKSYRFKSYSDKVSSHKQ